MNGESTYSNAIYRNTALNNTYFAMLGIIYLRFSNFMNQRCIHKRKEPYSEYLANKCNIFSQYYLKYDKMNISKYDFRF